MALTLTPNHYDYDVLVRSFACLPLPFSSRRRLRRSRRPAGIIAIAGQGIIELSAPIYPRHSFRYVTMEDAMMIEYPCTLSTPHHHAPLPWVQPAHICDPARLLDYDTNSDSTLQEPVFGVDGLRALAPPPYHLKRRNDPGLIPEDAAEHAVDLACLRDALRFGDDESGNFF